MADTVIRVSNVAKQYRLGEDAPYRRFSEQLNGLLVKPAQSLARRFTSNGLGTKARLSAAPAKPARRELMWALDDVSFTVARGEVLGVIGRNGAGKSTLLKILARITEPTRGRIEYRGRVGSLLEVGTGFHPELTGRENIHLSGAVLGMKRAEIKSKFDEIVAFAEVDDFIDTPVKRYSSGMQMRLAFAVAAHLEPEILLVDEVLAVGDAAFQKKCLGKMEDVATRDGRTVLFVSHNMGTIQQLCSRCILLHEGRVILDDAPGKAVSRYLSMGMAFRGEHVWPELNDAPGNDVARLHALRVTNAAGEPTTEFDVTEPVYLELHYWVLEDVPYLDASLYFFNERGELLFVSIDDALDGQRGTRARRAGLYRSRCCIPGNLLNDGRILIRSALSSETVLHASVFDVVAFSMADGLRPQGARGLYHAGEWPAASIRPKLEWTTTRAPLSERSTGNLKAA